MFCFLSPCKLCFLFTRQTKTSPLGTTITVAVAGVRAMVHAKFLTWLLPLLVLDAAAAASSLCSTVNTASSGASMYFFNTK